MLSVEDFGYVIGGVTTLITAIGGMAIWRGRSEVKNIEGPSAISQLKVAIDANTTAVNEQTEQFAENNRLFKAVLKEVEGLSHIAHDVRLDIARRR